MTYPTFEPMLCDTADKPLDFYLESALWWLQQKLDGHRVLLRVADSRAYPFNRNGESFRQKMSKQVLADFEHPAFTDECIFDGELLHGNHYYVFDVVKFLGVDLTTTPLCTRWRILEGLFSRWAPLNVSLVPMVTTEHGKRDLLAKIEAACGEGVIFKYSQGLYYPGKRSHEMLKYKFVDTGEVVITEMWRQGKRSVGIHAYDPGSTKPVDLGACTMSERNLARVKQGDVIEVKYLYRGAQGHLFQPRFVRLRDDKHPQDCLTTQFKHVNKEVIA